MSQEFAENKEDRCPVVLVLDTSGSMLDSRKIDELNAGVQQFRDEVVKDPIAALRIEIAVVSFGNGGVQVIEQFKSALDFQATPLTAGGVTPLGEGVTKALELVEDRKASYRANGVAYFRPWVWIMTDGQPTDEWQTVASMTRKAEDDKKVQVYAVGIGDDADMSVLSQFTPANRPAMKLKGMHFREMFKWLSASLARVSKGKANTGGPVPLPPTDGWGSAIA
jgi:uncharacterized protein YegL